MNLDMVSGLSLLSIAGGVVLIFKIELIEQINECLSSLKALYEWNQQLDGEVSMEKSRAADAVSQSSEEGTFSEPNDA